MTMMQAIRIHAFGGEEVLKQEEVAVSRPKSYEILVRIHAASINPIDSKIRSGARGNSADLPIAMGRDISGVVEACGDRILDAGKGDEVFAMLGPDRGGYAEYVTLKANEWARKPRKIDHLRAAAVPLAALTAWQGLFDHGKLTAGQRVLIHGGAGGVGHFAIQLAKAKGAWVATTVSQQDIDFVKSLGADQIIDRKAQKFEQELSDIDLVYDLVGGETQARSFQVLKQGGALISTLQQLDAALAAAKHIRVAHYMAEPSGRQLAEIATLIEDGRLRPVVAAIFPLADAAKAQARLEDGHIQGKIVLDIVPAPEAQDSALGVAFGFSDAPLVMA